MQILIIDYQNKSNFLLKNARYVGRSSVYGTPDGGRKTKFRTRIYFSHGDYEKLVDLQKMPKISKIRIFSKSINKLIGYPSLAIEKSEKEYVIRLSKEKLNNIIELNSNGIKNIVVSDDWTSKRDKTPFVLITLINSCRINPFTKEHNNLITTKPDKHNHGFGIKSIQKIVKKYHGDIQMYYNEESLTFHTIITLRKN